MKKELFCITVALSFIAGVIFLPMALVLWSHLKGVPSRYQEKREAMSFFYHTMNSLFEGTYNPKEGSVSQEFLERLKEYEPQLGGKCKLFVVDSTHGYYECVAFFPSGNMFRLAVARRDGRWKLTALHPQDWDRSWREILHYYHVEHDSD
jgi:hypothetical protein